MNDEMLMIDTQQIQDRIFAIRGFQVMLDRDLAELFGVETKVLNQAVKRNITRFPSEFRFQISSEENESLKSQIVTLEKGRGKHSKYLPYVFTEQGVAMLSAVLRSETAIKVSIKIIQAFVQMRHFLLENAQLFSRIERIEYKQIETDRKMEQIFQAIENKQIKPKQGIFFNGQIFDAYNLLADIIKTATKSIWIVDNYIDETILTLLAKNDQNISAALFSKTISKQIQLDIAKYNSQYSNIRLIKLTKSHDRFVIIDEQFVYHLGASIKDLGKKWFAFTKLENDSLELIEKLRKYLM
ncbi:MAG: ORF6N domain-containing protein [Candidatus Cloacimonetes bacterium]|nr:ORF6N domain-containing protein [Candidatus Cloacimonadota bacterium]MCF7869127.1 ORF6N domain-containing protein [Candidatus Cloacimonadota bacterium]MCF7884537.1 ORF6N domain-containing protein [Candidatus Cloacimonadota bacterium]